MVNIDRHPVDLVAALQKKFGSLQAFERANSLPLNTVSAGLRRPSRAVEAAVAKALGEPAAQIWPSRYLKDGTRKSPQPRANYGRAELPR